MTMSRGLIVVAMVAALLMAGAAADARSSKKKRAAMPATTATVPAPGAGAGMAGMGMAPRPGSGEPMVLQHFDEIDADHNQQLSRAEIEAWVQKAREQFAAQVKARFAAADTNGDGLLTADEARVGAPMIYEHFAFIDANQDGFVSPAELQQLGDRELMRQRILERVRAADTDHDGKLDLAEVQAAFPGMAGRFALMDRNGDGYLTPDDFMQGPGGP